MAGGETEGKGCLCTPLLTVDLRRAQAAGFNAAVVVALPGCLIPFQSFETATFTLSRRRAFWKCSKMQRDLGACDFWAWEEEMPWCPAIARAQQQGAARAGMRFGGSPGPVAPGGAQAPGTAGGMTGGLGMGTGAGAGQQQRQWANSSGHGSAGRPTGGGPGGAGWGAGAGGPGQGSPAPAHHLAPQSLAQRLNSASAAAMASQQHHQRQHFLQQPPPLQQQPPLQLGQEQHQVQWQPVHAAAGQEPVQYVRVDLGLDKP